MTFLLKQVKSEEMLEALSDWKAHFSKKQKGSTPTQQNAASIASQMIDTLETQRHGYLWMAKAETENKACAFLIADDSKSGLTIRFILSNVRDPEAKGSGRFLVEKMTEFADKKNLPIRTTSQNADAFWKKCPGFQLDKSNPPDYTYKPNSQTLQNSQIQQQFFNRNKESEKKDKQPSHKRNNPNV